MIKIHTADGETVRIDLADENQAKLLLRKLQSDSYQASIRGISIVETHEARGKCRLCGGKASANIGVQYSITRPEAFQRVEYALEDVPGEGKVKGGERVTVFADEARISLMVHRSQPAARITAAKVGKRKFSPEGR